MMGYLQYGLLYGIVAYCFGLFGLPRSQPKTVLLFGSLQFYLQFEKDKLPTNGGIGFARQGFSNLPTKLNFISGLELRI